MLSAQLQELDLTEVGNNEEKTKHAQTQGPYGLSSPVEEPQHTRRSVQLTGSQSYCIQLNQEVGLQRQINKEVGLLYAAGQGGRSN